MSRVESPFHAIAAQALDDTPDIETNGSVAAAAAPVVGTIADARDQERDSMKAASESHTENGRNEAADKNGVTEEEVEEETVVRQERKESLGVSSEGGADLGDTVTKKSKKRTNVWTKTTSRKTAKKSSVKNGGVRPSDTKDDNVLLKPFHQEDDPAYPILLSKIYKAEKIELSGDRLAASGSKGYRMVRATRGVVEGAWYFEILVDRLGETGHTRLGWSTRRGDIQAPVGYDAHSYSYRDVDGSKVHAARREDYGQPYHEKDVIGFYINLPREAGFTRKAEEEVVGYKGQPYIIVADEPLKPVPGSEILFFKNGVCQDVAFKDINDGSYFPAASMYTHPSQDCCKVVFNFGPDFKYPVTDLGDRPFPSPMCNASGPGQARAEAGVTTQTEVVADSTDNGGAKQQMASDRANVGEAEEATTATKAEDTAKDIIKASMVKKKEKVPKTPGGNPLSPPLSKKPKAGESPLNPEFKREVNLKAGKNDSTRAGLGSTGLPSQKGGKKESSGTGLANLKGIQKDTGHASLQGSKTASTGTGLSSLKGSKKDLPAAALQSIKGSKKGGMPGVVFPSLKGTGLPGIKKGKADSSEAGLPTLKGSKKGDTITGLQGLQGRNKDLTGVGGHSTKGIKRDTPGSGLPFAKRSKKDIPGTGSTLVASKDWSATGSALKPSKKGFPGTGSVPTASKKKDFSGTGFLSRRSGSSALSGQRSWGGGIRGTTMDVDVVVVESSTSFQAEGSVR